MNIRIFILLLALLLVSAPVVQCAEEGDDDSDDDITTMTFLVEYEDESENDLIEISLLVEADGSSLKTALTEASGLVASITNIAQSFCEEYNSKKVDCNEVVDTSDFEVEVDYQMVRKELEFSKFVVSHEIAVKVYATEKIGELADSFLKAGVTKIESFQWASEQEDDAEEGAIEAGKQKAHDMCFHLGMKLHRIVSIESVEEEEEDEGEEGEQEEEQEEAPLVYRFIVECIIDETTAAQKAEEEAEEDRLAALAEAEKKLNDAEDTDDDEDKKDEDEEKQDEQEEKEDEQEEEEKPKKKSKGKKAEKQKEEKKKSKKK